jgi:hypothetical protein
VPEFFGHFGHNLLIFGVKVQEGQVEESMIIEVKSDVFMARENLSWGVLRFLRTFWILGAPEFCTKTSYGIVGLS